MEMESVYTTYLLNVQKFYAITILTYGLSKCNRFFPPCTNGKNWLRL